MSFLSAVSSSVDASGGTTVQDVNINGVDYRVHFFENVNNDTFTVNSGGEVDVLIVGGGGAGGPDSSGGGGGGSVIEASTDVSSGTYNVVVGAGGAANTINSNYNQDSNGDGVGDATGEPGEDSSVFNIIATGGGPGGVYDGYDSPSGHANSGGGGTRSGNARGATSPTLPAGVTGNVFAGNTGGDGWSGNYAGGGGAGAVGNGGTGTSGGAGDGGDGVQINFTGNNYYWGGGGGGATWQDRDPGDGGKGGGGGGGTYNRTAGSGDTLGINDADDGNTSRDSSSLPKGDAGTNTGGGGGANTFHTNDGSVAGNGGSGIVIIRYEI